MFDRVVLPYTYVFERYCIGCSFIFLLKVGVEESIVNPPRVSCLNLISLFALFVFLQADEWCVHNRLFKANFEEKFN
jgi:hypothetical protein